MTKVQLGIAGIIIFFIGMCLGVKILDANKSIYAQVKFGDTGGFTVGRQLDLTQLSDFNQSDKVLLISGIKLLPAADEISQSIIELQKKGQGPFEPREYPIKLHITNEPSLNEGIAAFCETKGDDFYMKEIRIYDNRKDSITKKMITVESMTKYDSAYCLESEIDHVWVSPETAKNLLPSKAEPRVVNLLGRVSVLSVSNHCKAAI